MPAVLLGQECTGHVNTEARSVCTPVGSVTHVSERINSCNIEPPLTASTPLSTVNFLEEKRNRLILVNSNADGDDGDDDNDDVFIYFKPRSGQGDRLQNFNLTYVFYRREKRGLGPEEQKI